MSDDPQKPIRNHGGPIYWLLETVRDLRSYQRPDIMFSLCVLCALLTFAALWYVAWGLSRIF